MEQPEPIIDLEFAKSITELRGIKNEAQGMFDAFEEANARTLELIEEAWRGEVKRLEEPK